MENEDYVGGRGSLSEARPAPDYLKMLAETIDPLPRKLKVVR